MGDGAGMNEQLVGQMANVFAEVRVFLDERQRRLLLGSMARELGRGGQAALCRVTGVARDVIGRGAGELEAGIEPDGRARRRGAGRRALTELDPELSAALEQLVDAESRGDPVSALKWTTKSTGKLAEQLTGLGHACGPRTVAKLLHARGFSLRGNAKVLEGKQHPDRDAQFRYINTQVAAFQDDGQPVISVDTKAKQPIGNYANGGTEWSRQARQVNSHDFPDKQLGKVAPYGIFDMAANTGWVNVGTSADTAQFAVESIRRWWKHEGSIRYNHATRLLITADSGGSNGSRLRLWKTELGKLAAETRLQITVLHFPPGTSKWNRVEHRLFSFITMNWRGRPLESHQVVVETIAATTTTTGLTVCAMLDENTYEKGIKISDKEMQAWEEAHLHRHEFHGEWNYRISASAAA